MPKCNNSFLLSQMCHMKDQVLNNVKYMAYKVRILMLTNPLILLQQSSLPPRLRLGVECLGPVYLFLCLSRSCSLSCAS